MQTLLEIIINNYIDVVYNNIKFGAEIFFSLIWIYSDLIFSFEYIYDFNNKKWQLSREVLFNKFLSTTLILLSDIQNYQYHQILIDLIGQFNFISNSFQFNFYWTSLEWSLLNLNIHELYLSNELINFFFTNYVSSISLFSTHASTVRHGYLFVQTFFDYTFFLICVYIMLLIGFMCYSSVFKIDNSIDHDYSNSFSLILSEKELNAFDDIINLFFILVFFFGWFIYLYGLKYFFFYYDISMLFLFLPLFNYSLMLIPLFIIMDFSYNFISYLRGISVSSSFLIEFIFDYITLLGFLLRTFVQNVRFLIIILVCYSINELWLFYDMSQTFFFYDDQSFNDILNLNFSFFLKLYYILFFLLKQCIYLIYEIIHTFFVIVIQISSFLIMIFWLFSFLYTYFSISIHENFFLHYRQQKQQKINLNSKFKKNIL